MPVISEPVISEATRDFLVLTGTVGVVYFGVASALDTFRQYARDAQLRRNFRTSALIAGTLVLGSALPLAISDLGHYLRPSSALLLLSIIATYIVFFDDVRKSNPSILFPFITIPLLLSGIVVSAPLLCIAAGLYPIAERIGLNDRVIYNLVICWVALIALIRAFLMTIVLSRTEHGPGTRR